MLRFFPATPLYPDAAVLCAETLPVQEVLCCPCPEGADLRRCSPFPAVRAIPNASFLPRYLFSRDRQRPDSVTVRGKRDSHLNSPHFMP